jgi:predicted DsbA family dithiol-disulfide isomerase
LHPEIPDGGLLVADIYRARGIDLDTARARLQEAANDAGLPLGQREKTYNSRLAQELGKWADDNGKGSDYHHAVFRAYFVEAKNIGSVDILMEMIEALHLPVSEGRDILEKGIYRKAVDDDWARSQSLGITAVPTLLLNRKMIVGAQPYEAMEWFLKMNNVMKR